MVFAAKPNNAQIKYDAHVSTDVGVSYLEEAPDADYAVTGTITEAVDRLTATKLTSLTFTPTNSFDATRLESATTTEIAAGTNLIYWEDTGEWGAVEDVTNNGDGTYTLENVWRAVGGFDSVPAPHAVTQTVWFFTYGKGLSAEHTLALSLRLKLISNAPGGDYPLASACGNYARHNYPSIETESGSGSDDQYRLRTRGDRAPLMTFWLTGKLPIDYWTAQSPSKPQTTRRSR